MSDMLHMEKNDDSNTDITETGRDTESVEYTTETPVNTSSKVRTPDLAPRIPDFAPRTSDSGSRTSDSGPQISDSGHRTLEHGPSITDYGSRTATDEIFEVHCDVCSSRCNSAVCRTMYCPECMRKLCHNCTVIHNRLGETRGHSTRLETCWPCGKVLTNMTKCTNKADELHNTLTTVASKLQDDLGIQVCIDYDAEEIEFRAPTEDILDVAISTVRMLQDPAACSSTGVYFMVKHGHIEWTVSGRLATTIRKLFQEELNRIVELCVVEDKINIDNEQEPASESRSKTSAHMASDSNILVLRQAHIHQGEEKLIVRTNFYNFDKIKVEIEKLLNAAKSLPKAELIRPKCDEFRMQIFSMTKEVHEDVVCFVDALEDGFKLVIQSRDEHIVRNVKEEFLSLFCKECSSCHEESQIPTYLECKHVLCFACVTVATPNNDKIRCSVCNDKLREKTPFTSLKLNCLQVIDEITTKTKTTSNNQGNKTSQKNRVTKAQCSVKIPRYLLNKWKKQSGGIKRLKSLIMNTYGLQVTGSDDNLEIYGHQNEILELAVQTLETLNSETSRDLDNDVTARIVDKCVEWRFRGDYARMSHFLFNKELLNLRRKFRTVTIRSFTETTPNIVDVRCAYSEYIKVKYEIDELVNELKGLFTDECIQPRNFFFNEKVKDFVHVKQRDDKVYCTHTERNNLNVVTLRGRCREHIQSAKEQLLRWS